MANVNAIVDQLGARWPELTRSDFRGQFAAANPHLLAHGMRVLSAYYRPETLRSELARRVFVRPDAGREPAPR